ncbi:MAG: type II secretion system F family protein [Gemmataceae bacterium]
MREAAVFAFLLLAVAFVVATSRRIRNLREAKRRLDEPDSSIVETPVLAPTPLAAPPALRNRLWWLPAVLGIAVAASLHWLVRWPMTFAGAGGLITIMLASIVLQWRIERRVAMLENQLASAVDLMIAALQAGGSVMQSLENATRETKAPLRPYLDQLLGRVRFGDAPSAAVQSLERQMPLPTVRLFVSALAVHWEVGGSLTNPLSIVGRTIRDRLEMSRRVRSLTVQSRASTLAILATTYFIGVVVWRNNPERMVAFLNTTVGQWMASAGMLLQAVGISWSARISKMEY